jgi:hypothetical protein
MGVKGGVKMGVKRGVKMGVKGGVKRGVKMGVKRGVKRGVKYTYFIKPNKHEKDYTDENPQTDGVTASAGTD